MDPGVALKDYVDARDDAIESRLSAQLGNVLNKRAFWSGVGVIMGGIFTALGVILATMAFGSDRFNGGLSISPAIAEIQGEQAKKDEAQDAKFELLDRKLNILIERSGAK